MASPTPRVFTRSPIESVGSQRLQTLVTGLAIAGLALLTTACAAPSALTYPMQIRMQAEPPATGAATYPRWCEGGTCAVGPKVVLDERNVRSVMLQPGETRAGVLLHLNDAGVTRLRLFLAGNAGDQRLTLVVDGKAMEAWSARQALKTSTIKLTGPTADMLRLHQKLRGVTPVPTR